MHAYPGTAVTRSRLPKCQELKRNAHEITQVFMGRSADVDETNKRRVEKARSLRKGLLPWPNICALRSKLYRGLHGATLWTRSTSAPTT